MDNSNTYLTTMDELFSIGMEYAQNDATVLANYHISSALAGASSLRLCIDRILYNRGEGDSFADVIGSAPYSDWNELRRVNRTSPYPAFFAGLIYELQEKRDNAEACYREAQLCPGFTLELRNFMCLGEMSIKELYALRERAAEPEAIIYGSYRGSSYAYDLAYLDCLPDFHVHFAEEALNGDTPDFAEALKNYENALAVSPFEPELYALCSLIALYAESPEKAQRYIGEGLYLAPQDGRLNAVAAALYASAGEFGVAGEYLTAAKVDAALSARFAALLVSVETAIGGSK